MNLIDQIREGLAHKLKGEVAHKPMMGYTRANPSAARRMDPPARESAVMMLLFQRKNEWYTLLMMRPDGQSVHSNQLSFPGGRIEQDETPVMAALRETFEEVGLEPAKIEVLGQMTELYIPPSHFIVQPFIGLAHPEPVFSPSASEVFLLVEEKVSSFLREDIIREKEIFIPQLNRSIMARYFDVQGHTLWGATAMIVQEFRVMMGFET